MNLPSSLKTLTTKQYQLTAKQRLIVIVAIGIMAILITIYATSSNVAVEPTLPINNAQQTATISSKSVLPAGTQMIPVNPVEQTMRDPFARPPEAKEQKNDGERSLPVIQNTIPSNISAMIPKKIAPSMSHENLRLTGIVGTADQRLAVIMSANKSRSYSVNEVIGTYKLMSINNDYVILTNADGNLLLRLEPTGQKGDNKSEK